MSYDITATFQLDPDSADYGKIRVVTTTNTGDSSSVHRLGIIAPNGTVLRDINTALPSIGINAFWGTIDIPTVGGVFLEGDYVFVVRIDDDGDASIDLNQTYTFCFYIPEDNQQPIDTYVQEDCWTKQIVLRDDSAYKENATVINQVKIDTPIIVGEDDVADATVSMINGLAQTISLTRSSGTAYWNVTYGFIFTADILLKTEVEQGDADWLIQIDYARKDTTVEKLIQCGKDVCGVVDCVNAFVEEVEANACKRGGYSKLPCGVKDQLDRIQLFLSLYQFYIKCQNTVKSNYYYNKIKEITGSCDCDAVTGPQIITDDVIAYLEGDSAYQIWLNNGNSGTQQDFLDSIGGWSDWTEVPAGNYGSYHEPGGVAVKYRTNGSHLEIIGDFRKSIGASYLDNPVVLFDDEAIDVDVEQAGLIPIYETNIESDKGGRQVGYLSRNAGTGNWEATWMPGEWNDTYDLRIAGMIPKS
jgi:hypothetical protein